MLKESKNLKNINYFQINLLIKKIIKHEKKNKKRSQNFYQSQVHILFQNNQINK